jgi:F-box and leucine-rich repeat protein 14
LTGACGAGFQSICSIIQLQELRIGGCGTLTPDALLHILRLSRLTTLELCGGRTAAHPLPSTLVCKLACSLTGLQQLSLRNMHVQGLEQIGLLSKLQMLSLDRADTRADSSVHPAVMADAVLGLTQMKQLLLWCDNAECLARRPWARLRSMAALTTLTVSCEVGDEQLLCVADLPRLQTLEVMHADSITDRALEALACVPDLRNLDLLNCPLVGDGGLAHLTARAQLLTLRLKGSQISDRSVAEMGKLAQLRNLSIARTSRITSAALEALARAPALKILDLAGCVGLTDRGLEALVGLRELRHLNLERCRGISNDGVEAFKAQLLATGPLPEEGGANLASCVVVFF